MCDNSCSWRAEKESANGGVVFVSRAVSQANAIFNVENATKKLLHEGYMHLEKVVVS